jgi:hypothetical protein
MAEAISMKTHKTQNKVWLWLVVLVAVGLLVPGLSWASASSVIAQTIGNIIFYILFWPFIKLLEVELIVLPIIAQFNNFTNLPGVVTGWTAMRDLVNMFFIVILLIMAFSTILKMQAYGYKQLLRNLIIMAILVNFSKLIVGLVIDFFQVIMLTFVSSFKDVAAGNIAVALGIDGLVEFATSDEGLSQTDVFGQIILGYLLASIMVVLAAIVVMAFIIILTMRIVVLWILVVLAPLAFLANTFPLTKQHFTTWLSMFSKEVAIGPILAFFLWLSFTIVGEGNITDDFKGVSKQQEMTGDKSLTSGVGPTEAGKWDNILKYIVGLSMLIGSLKIAQGFGSKAGAMGAGVGLKMQKGVGSFYRRTGQKAWSGSTGAGGVRGGLQRAGTPLATGLMTGASKVTPYTEFFKRAGMRIEGSEIARKQQKVAKIEDQAKNVRDKELYHGSRGSIYGDIALYKEQIASGTLTDKEDAEDAKELLTKVNDKESIQALMGSTAYVHDQESVGKMFKGKSISMADKIDTASLDSSGGQAVASYIAANFNATQIEKFLESKSAGDEKSWRGALRKTASQSRITRGRDGVIDKDAAAYKMALIDNEAYTGTMQRPEPQPGVKSKGNEMTSAEKEDLAKERAKKITDKNLLKMEIGKPDSDQRKAFEAMSRQLSLSKALTVARDGDDEEKTQIVVAQQTLAGRNISALKANPATNSFINIQNIQKSFQTQIEALPDDQKAAKREQLAKDNLSDSARAFTKGASMDGGKYQGVDFGGDAAGKASFISFVNGLNARQASQISKFDLMQVFNELDPNIKSALQKQGIGPKEKGGSSGHPGGEGIEVVSGDYKIKDSDKKT